MARQLAKMRKPKPVEGAAVEPMRLVFVVPGRPRTKKNSSRVVRNGGFTRVLPSAAHEAWYSAARLAFDADVRAMKAAERIPVGRPVRVSATFFRDRNTGDLVGYQQALADFLEGQGVLVDDKWITSWDGTRLDKDADRPRIEVALEVLP
jgi:Holliday junction resolvase RusA-like endonuclease